MRYVIFQDSRAFNADRLWEISDVKIKYPHSKIEIVNAAFVTVTAPDGKELQEGVMISADSEYDALRKYTGLRDGRRK